MRAVFSLIFSLTLCLTAALESSAQLPSVQVKDLSGKTVDTATLSNDGKPFAISFFATWCKPCKRELAAIAEVYPDWQDETGMKMYIVSIDEAQNVSKVKPLVDAEGWDYEVLLDPNSEFKNALGIQLIPHMLIIDGKGEIVYSHSGYTDGSETEVIKKIRSLISAE
ncbi:MAG: TlpA family protein disulfide reductase [Muribaculaceae bacterium]|nr:TlpA family protein disulfide reductase [Muribaculaceae bacterium]